MVPLVPEKSLFLYLLICKHTDVGGRLLAKGIFPVRQYGAIEESQVFTLRVMKLELGTAQRGSQMHTTAAMARDQRGHGHIAAFPPLLHR